MDTSNLYSLNFTNKKTKQYVHKLTRKDSFSLLNSLRQREQSIKSDLSIQKINKEQFKKVAIQVQSLGYDEDYCMVFGIYGPKIDRINKDCLVFTLDRIICQSFYQNKKNSGQAKGFKKYSTEGITLVFFNNCATKKKQKLFSSTKDISDPIKIDDFKYQVIKELGLQHLIKINKVYLVYPSLLTRSWNYFTSFGVQNGFFDTYFNYIDSIYDLAHLMGPLFEAHKIESSVLFYDSSINSKNWRSLYSETHKAHSFNQFKSYQKMCELSSVDNLQNFPQYSYKKTLKEYFFSNQHDVPLVLLVLTDRIVKNHLNFEGLFRKVAQERELIKFQNYLFGLQQKVSQSQVSVSFYEVTLKENLPNYEIQTVTSFIKKIFMQLEEPIFSSKTYNQIARFSGKQIETWFKPKTKQKQNKITFSTSQTKNISSMVNSLTIDQSNLSKGKVWQRVAFFQSLSKQQNNMYKTVNSDFQKQSTNQHKISFKKVPNGKTITQFSLNTQPQIKELFSLHQMKKENPIVLSTLVHMIKFLNMIKKQQKFNLMTSSNLAICFNPCFFRSLNNSQQQMLRSVQQQCSNNMKLVKVLQKLIDNPELLNQA